MLRLKTIGEVRTTGARKTGNRAATGILVAGLLMAGAAQGLAQQDSAEEPQMAQTQTATTQTKTPTTSSKIGPAAPVTYDNKYEIFAGFNFQNFMAGEHLPKRMNLGGGRGGLHLLAAGNLAVYEELWPVGRLPVRRGNDAGVFQLGNHIAQCDRPHGHQQPAAGVSEYAYGRGAVSHAVEEPVCRGRPAWLRGCVTRNLQLQFQESGCAHLAGVRRYGSLLESHRAVFLRWVEASTSTCRRSGRSVSRRT